MGALIQTKGTQQLAKWLNDRFDERPASGGSGLILARSVNALNPALSLRDAFKNNSNSLLDISEKFIAQFAGAGWPTDGNDLLYPSATMKAVGAPTGKVLHFSLPTGVSTTPERIKIGNSVCCFKPKNAIQPGTMVKTVSGVTSGNFDVELTSAPKNITGGELISFGAPKHPRLVKRWRWYLKTDLLNVNHKAIREAISTALEDSDYTKITFQAIEDTQRVVAVAQPYVDSSFEYDDSLELQIVLFTQATTAPDPIDN